ncbi:MAG: hypothetical protein J0G98_20415 [Terrimonas ferruginea]|uniref:hypothetical protein n=1 Tax=Terrimonas ferruginea TaxID=249 RepID=UPI00092BB170|nr:hypothetical protein [Terrimonas ferruginea]MBN8785427.1 hypothetical protein [Terrimonas ferruginea]OJW45484.1 MAG: hypothetical protein BGO56_02035 [Sphingobacteriales bacterium 48-107]
MNKIVALIYWIFKSEKKQSTPYLSTILALSGIIFLLVCIVFLLFDLPTVYLFPFDVQNPKVRSWINGAFMPTILGLMLLLLFPNKKLKTYQFSSMEIGKGRRMLIVLFFTLVLLLALALVKHGIQKGMIKV